MHDAPTQLSAVSKAQPARPKPVGRRVSLIPLKRFSRAHLELASRPALRAEAKEALGAALTRVGGQLGHAFTADSRVLDGTLQPLQHLGRESLFVVVELTTASTLAVVELEGPVVAHLLRVAAGSDIGTAVVNTLTRIESAAMGWLALSAIAGLRSVPGFDARYGARLVSLTVDRGEALRAIDPTVRHFAIELQLTGEHPIGVARILVPAKMLQLAIQSSPATEAPPAQEVVLSATLEACVRFGRASIAIGDVGRLTEGDVIVFAKTALRDGHLLGPVRLLTRTFEVAGELGSDGLAITTLTPHTPESPMATTITVNVEIELTSIQLPIRQLGTVAPGSVLPLHINAAQQVTLRIDGRRIALAELVEVEGEIGARITAMLEEAP